MKARSSGLRSLAVAVVAGMGRVEPYQGSGTSSNVNSRGIVSTLLGVS